LGSAGSAAMVERQLMTDPMTDEDANFKIVNQFRSNDLNFEILNPSFGTNRINLAFAVLFSVFIRRAVLVTT
jgi:hypothetical protein